MSKLYQWVDERAGITDILNFAVSKKIPGNISWFHTLGTTSLFLFTVQIVTGIFLALNYTPDIENAHRSVQFIQQNVRFGEFIRGLHFYGATMMVTVVTLHMLRVAFYGAYKKPRELTWLIGVLILICTMALGLTGYLLPWDQKAYYATKVVLEIVRSADYALFPGFTGIELPIGTWSMEILQGTDMDQDMGAPTLTHFYAFHTMVFPFIMFLLVGAHLWLVLRQGIATPWVAKDSDRPKTELFWPTHILKDLVVVSFVFILMIVMYFAWGNHLDELANPLDDLGYLPRPEWYFMWLFQMLKIFEDEWVAIGTIIIPGLILVFLFLLPWLDRGRSRHPKDRPVIMAAGGAMIIGIVWLSWQSYMDDHEHHEKAIQKISYEKTQYDWYMSLLIERSLHHDFTTDEDEGWKLYRNNLNCSACHMMNGLGGSGLRPGSTKAPSLTYAGSRFTPDYLKEVILNGFPATQRCLSVCYSLPESEQENCIKAVRKEMAEASMPAYRCEKDYFPLGAEDPKLDKLVAYLMRNVEPDKVHEKRYEIWRLEAKEKEYRQQIRPIEDQLELYRISQLPEDHEDREGVDLSALPAGYSEEQEEVDEDLLEALNEELADVRDELDHLRTGSLQWNIRDPKVRAYGECVGQTEEGDEAKCDYLLEVDSDSEAQVALNSN